MASSRRRKSVLIDEELVEQAESMHIDPSRAAEAGIARAVAGKTAAQRWAEENADAIRSMNEWVEKNGLPLAKYRQF